MAKNFELTGIGNAIVDVITRMDDAFLSTHNIDKGAMTLIDEPRAKALYAALGQGHEVSGGSAANTMAGFASLGGHGAYMGKVAADQLGDIFAHDMKAVGVHYATPRLEGGPETARCMIIVTPDAERSMSTYLGASVEFNENDLDKALITDSAFIYMEGYLFDKDPAKKAYHTASTIARDAGTKVALTLSDSFCVDRHRADFLSLIENETDIVFANEAELLSLFETSDFATAVALLRSKCDIAAITRSEKGSIILNADQTIEVKAHPVSTIIDTTGAGDQYAAGFLYGMAKGHDLAKCGDFGSLAAAEVISHLGPRPETSLADLATKKL